MITEDQLLRGCRAYQRMSGHAPCYLNVHPRDWFGVQYLLRNIIDDRGRYVIGPYRLTTRLDGKSIEGQVLVTHHAIKANTREVELPSMMVDPEFQQLRVRVRPGGVSVHMPD